MKKVNESVEFENLFTPEELEVLNFSEDELALLQGSYILSETAKILPDNDKALVEKIKKTFEDLDEEQTKAKVQELLNTDPEFIKQMTTLYSLYALGVDEDVPSGQVEKVNLSEIQDVKNEEQLKDKKAMMDSIIATIKSVD